MYKKTTTIIEEHSVSSEEKSKDIFSVIPNENTNLAISLKTNSRNYWSIYAMLIREYLNLTITKQIAESTRELIAVHSTANFSTYLTPWIVQPMLPVHDQLIISSKTMSDGIVAMINDIGNGKDQGEAISTAKNAAGDFATQLGAACYLLAKEKTLPILNNYIDTVTAQISNKMSGRVDPDTEAYFKGYSILASNVYTSPTFADAVANGFIQSQPWRF